MKPDFSGYATRNDLVCSDGRVIRKNAFKHNDGETVPLVWDHHREGPNNVLGHAVLENREDGVYTYGYFNDTEDGKKAKELVKHGDIRSLSIYANKLKHSGRDVIHGIIREVSLVLAGANPGAFIDEVMAHGENGEDGMIIGYDENIMLYHSDEKASDSKSDKEEPKDGETVQDVIDSMTEKQKNVMYALVGQALEGEDSDEENDTEEDSKGGNEVMKQNVFDNDRENPETVLTHADQESIIRLAKTKSVGSFREALHQYIEENNHLSHGIDDIEELFPDHEWVNPGAPEMILPQNLTWVDQILNKVHKSPISRVRMRFTDLREADLRAMGYTKGEAKVIMGKVKLLKRSFDPQTVYVKDTLERDDIIDITDFDVVDYQRRIMRQTLNEEVATAILIGDGRDEADENKIQESHIRSIWNDDELFTIHQDVDIAKAKEELQGTNTGANFGENYIYAEAIITSALYAREKYRGSGSLDFYCTPHLLNVMLLARDLNGRRIYTSKADLAAALDVNNIYTVEKFEGKVRETTDSKKKKLLGLFTNISDYRIGSTKGGQITNFDDFDIDFNQYKYLMETRLSGAPTKVFSSIALEEDVTPNTTTAA